MTKGPSAGVPTIVLVEDDEELANEIKVELEGDGYLVRRSSIADAAGATGEFRVITALTDAFLPEQFAAVGEQGITDVWTMPWAYYHGLEASLEQKLDGIRRFAEDVLVPLGAGALTDR